MFYIWIKCLGTFEIGHFDTSVATISRRIPIHRGQRKNRVVKLGLQ